MKREPAAYFTYRDRRKKYLVILTLLLLAAIVVAAGVGAVPIPIRKVSSILLRGIPLASRWIPDIGSEDAHATIILEVRSVSYTHLDVYKRQVGKIE